MVSITQKTFFGAYLLSNCALLCLGMQCERECCYWYSRFPATPSNCITNTMSTTVNLVCEVQYWFSDISTIVELKWYWSRSEVSAGIEGENIFSSNPTTHTSSANNNDTDTILSTLPIMNFDDRDRGYYWCQIVVNNDTLPPSPFGYIYSTQCMLFDFVCSMTDQLLCAQNSTSRLIARKQANGTICTLEDFVLTTPSKTTTLSETDIETQSKMKASSFPISVAFTSVTNSDDMTIITVFDTETTEKCDFTKTGYRCLIGVIVGVLLLIIVCLLILNVSTLVFFLKKRKNKEFTVRQYDSTVHQCDGLEPVEVREFSNPHYFNVTIKDDLTKVGAKEKRKVKQLIRSVSPVYMERASSEKQLMINLGENDPQHAHSIEGVLVNTSTKLTDDMKLESIELSLNEAYSSRPKMAENTAKVYNEKLQSQFSIGITENRKHSTAVEVCQQPYYEEVSMESGLTKVGAEEKRKHKQFSRSQSPDYTEVTNGEKQLSNQTIEGKEKPHYNESVVLETSCTGEVEYCSPHTHCLIADYSGTAQLTQHNNSHSDLVTVMEDV